MKKAIKNPKERFRIYSLAAYLETKEKLQPNLLPLTWEDIAEYAIEWMREQDLFRED